MASSQLEERGYFWWADDPVPEGHCAPERAVTGQIQVGANGATLLILDDLLPRAPGRPNLDPGAIPSQEPELAVVGLIKKGQVYVRLEQLSWAGLSLGGVQRASESLKARICVHGRRLIKDLPPNRYCTSIRLSLAGFDEWLQLDQPKLETGETELAGRITRRPEKVFEIDNATISVGVEVNFQSDNPLTELILRQEGYLTYTPSSPMTLEEVRDTVRKLEDLLVLLTNCERTLGFPQVKISSADDWNEVSYEILQRGEKEISRADLWTTFPHLANFGEIANSWFTKSAEFGPGFHLYLGSRRGIQLYVEHRFANFVWGLEAFHRSSGVESKNAALENKIKRILNAVGRRDRKWLENKLNHAVEPTLSQRIFDVLFLLPLGFNKIELKSFADKCAKERNIISHFGGRGVGARYEDHLVTWVLLSYALDVLYHARILQELGFNETELQHIFWDVDTFPAVTIRQALVRNGLNIPERKAGKIGLMRE